MINDIYNRSDFPSKTHSVDVAQKRIDNFMTHSCEVLVLLENQNLKGCPDDRKVAGHVNQVFLEAQSELAKIAMKMEESLQNRDSPDLSAEEIKEFAKTFKAAEKDVVKVIQKAQINAAAEIGSEGRAELKNKIVALAENRWDGKIIQLLALVSSTHRAAVEGFEKTKVSLDTAYKAPLSEVGESKLQKHKRKEFDRFISNRGDLKRRVGVIGLNGIYRIEPSFSSKHISKQLKSYIAQNQSEKVERKVINRDLTVQNSNNVSAQFQSKLIPLNSEFDTHVDVLKNTKDATVSTQFKKIFGESGGISSANRQEAHLVNAWESKLTDDKGHPIYEALRHGVISDRFETNEEIRRENSEKAAKELIKAVVLQKLASSGTSLEEAANNGVVLNLNSVSLITPDDLRGLISINSDEKKMLQDQINALNSYVGPEKTIKIDGVSIPLNLKVNAFNFGVNAGAVNYGLGTENQYAQNVKALKGLEENVSDTMRRIDFPPHEKEELSALLANIKLLMADRKAYLDGDNQYEVGAKIINLSNQLDRLNGETKCAFNCMSGKDRTGMLDGVAKAFAVMKSINGSIPSHEDLKNDEATRQEFRDILVSILLEMGGLEITEINTGAVGYKLGKEAQLAGLSGDKFLEMLGLSKTTSS